MEQHQPTRKCGTIRATAIQISFSERDIDILRILNKSESSKRADSDLQPDVGTELSCTIQCDSSNFATSSVPFERRISFNLADGFVCESSSCKQIRVTVKSLMDDDAVSIIGQGNFDLNDLESTFDKEISQDAPLLKDSKQIGIATLEIKVDPPAPITSDSKRSQSTPALAEDKSIIAKRKAIARKGSANLVSSKDISFRKLFSLPESEGVLLDFSCALLSDFLHHGRIFISRSYLCFYSQLFGLRKVEAIPFSEILGIEQKDILVGNPGIFISTKSSVFQFGSFMSRDKSHAKIVAFWKDSINYPVPSLSKSEIIVPGNSFSSLSNSDSGVAVEELNSSQGLEIPEDDEFNLKDSDIAEAILVSDKLYINFREFFDVAYSNDSVFIKRYRGEQGNTDFYAQKWIQTSENQQFRSVIYRSPVPNNSVTRVEEVQRYQLHKDNFTIETIFYMLDVPYGENFHTKLTHSINQEGDSNSCQISISATVQFTKKVLLEGKIRAQTTKLVREKSEAFVALVKDEISRRPRKPKQENLLENSQVTAIITRVPAKLRTSNLLQRPLFINGFLFSVMGLAMIILYVKLFILAERVRVLEEKQNQSQLA